ELQAQGHAFATDGDAEVILAAWSVWGTDCVSRFNGMFALALWDGERLFCARDRFGEKPFLYAQGDGFLAFASEYKALLALEGVSAGIHETALARFLITPADGLDRDGATLFPAIRQLPPAHVMVVDPDLSVRLTRYWDGAADESAAGLSDVQASDRFRELLDDSVRLRLRSDVPVGSCLSGGLDSGSIACLVRRQLGAGVPYHTFSGRFPGAAVDEGEYMDVVADVVQPVRHEIAPDPARLVDELAEFAWANELPVDSASQYAQYCVFRAARAEGVVVLLDGQGADEILGGYEQYFAAYLAETGAAERAAVDARYPGALDHVNPWHARLPVALRRRLAHVTGKGSDLAFGLNPDLVPKQRPKPMQSLHQALRRDALGGFLGTLLRYGDRNSMAHSVEVRLPFTDHRLFEFAQGLSPRLLMGDAQTKRLLRQAMAGILPDKVRNRWRKQGFLPPHAAWLQGGLIGAAQAAVAECDPVFWNRGWWRATLARFQAGDTSLATGLWKVLATEAWRRHFLGPASAQPKYAPLI
ncbi:MAG: asparagine synthase (glutamine-hydrolyzing), partial [Magnetospirillum sp.]|nr:asparagine synthase (glutamine-hydrolyzing) [Magnetospirillum sp.]